MAESPVKHYGLYSKTSYKAMIIKELIMQNNLFAMSYVFLPT